MFECIDQEDVVVEAATVVEQESKSLISEVSNSIPTIYTILVLIHLCI